MPAHTNHFKHSAHGPDPKCTDMEEPNAQDERLDFIANYVLPTLKVKRDKWQKLVSGEDELRLLQDFLDGAAQRSLLVSLTAAGQLQPTGDFAAEDFRNRAVYFVKRRTAALNPVSMRESLLCGELSCEPLGQFSALVEEVSRAERSSLFIISCCYMPGGWLAGWLRVFYSR